MKRTILTTAAIAFTSFGAFAQPAAPLSFDVASVKPSQPGSGHRGPPKIGAEILDAYLEVRPGSVTLRGARIGSVIKWAYAVQEHQVSGPGWLNSDRFDIVAKAAGPAPENQLRLMMQTLLTERFKLSFHRQTKELSAYALTVGKNGHKLKPSQGDGETVLQPNKMGLIVKYAVISEIAAMLAQPLRQPVLDMTGLTGKFDFELDMARYITEEMTKSKPGDPPPDIIGIGIAAIQEQLGLKIEAKKLPVEILIVDHMEKVPTEN
jgi:uncharacterized protein (TIGR03435 family)